MSVSVPRPARADQAPHERLVVVAAALATLGAIAVPMVAAALGRAPVPAEPGPRLTVGAERVLRELPAAYETGGLVVVPAAADPYVAWAERVEADRVVGARVRLGGHGLAEYGYLPADGALPGWLAGLSAEDGVYSDVGALMFACTRWPGEEDCSGALLMEDSGFAYLFRSGLDVLEPSAGPAGFAALQLGMPTTLVLGAMPPGAGVATVTAEGSGGHREVPARVSEPGAVGGATLWWAFVDDPALVTFRDADGRVVSRTPVPG